MTVYIENHLPVVKYNGLNTEKDVTLAGTNTISGATTISGALTLTGALTGNRLKVTLGTAGATLTADDSGTIFVCTKTSGTQAFVLPAVTGNAGVFYVFYAGHADTEILIDQAASEVITITTFAAVGADADTSIVTTAGGTGIKNTAGSNAIGDSIILFCDGVGWRNIGVTSGIWASQ